jgi:hypothetical protein
MIQLERKKETQAGIRSDEFVSFLQRRNFVDNERRNGYFNHGRRRTNGRGRHADREESIRRTVYVSELDHTVSNW